MESDARESHGRGRWIWAAVVVGALLLIFVPLLLHFTQKRHDRMAFDVSTQYPEGQPIVSGEVFASTLIALIEQELQGTTGWRPNDFFLWGPGLWADNNANRQRGIIQAARESLRVLKDHLTKVSSDQFDPNLVAADNALRNDMEKLWLPSAESKLREAVKHLRLYVAGLHTTPPRSNPIKERNVELIRLFQTWTDLLGDAHGSLYRKQVGFFATDDVFYHSQGFAHVMYHLNQAVAREYEALLQTRPVLETLMNEITEALGKAAVLKPVVILDGSSDGILANHRRNLDGYITEARQKMYTVREELEK